jgi:hypothetical protein
METGAQAGTPEMSRSRPEAEDDFEGQAQESVI